MPPTAPAHPDDNLMERFDREGVRRFRARDGVIAVAIAACVLVVCAGASVKRAGEEMSPGIGRAIVLAVGRPAAWISDQLPLRSAAHTLTAWLSPNQSLGTAGRFVSDTHAAAQAVAPVTPDAFAPSQLGVPRPPRRRLRSLLVTGDSMSQPLDQDLAQALEPDGVRVIQDPHFGSAISNTACILFNSRGIPVDSTGTPTSNDSVYLTDGSGGYFAVTAAPSGRIRIYHWAASAWNGN